MGDYFAVMGNPIAHSLSPLIHSMFAKQTGHSLLYEKLLIEEHQFEQQVVNFFLQGGTGLNITLPFKQRAFAMSKEPTKRCVKAKAANVLWMNEKKIYADNTDGVGLVRDIKKHIGLDDKNVLILGAGGATRGIVYPLWSESLASLTIANRTIETAKALAQECIFIDYLGLENLKAKYDIIINATSASFTQKTLHFSERIFENKPYCYDLSYSATGPTSFVTLAHSNGCKAQDGLGMLVEQAAESFFIWNGVKPNTPEVISILRIKQKMR